MVTRNDIKDLLRKIKLDYPKFSLPREEQRALEMVESWYESLSKAKDREHLFAAYKGWKDHESETPTISDIRQRIFGGARQGGKTLTLKAYTEYAEAQGLKVFVAGNSASAMRPENCVEFDGKFYPLIDFCNQALSPAVVKDQFRAFSKKHTSSGNFSDIVGALHDPTVRDAYQEFRLKLKSAALSVAHTHGLRYQEGA